MLPRGKYIKRGKKKEKMKKWKDKGNIELVIVK
jgi:hypothetical protein